LQLQSELELARKLERGIGIEKGYFFNVYPFLEEGRRRVTRVELLLCQG